MKSPTRTYLTVPFSEKDEAKKYGARWDGRSWYAPPGVDLAPFARWSRSSIRPPAVEFSHFGRSHGLHMPDEALLDGPTLHRVPVDGDRPGERSGTYVGFSDGHPAGQVWNWKTGGDAKTWSWSGTTATMVVQDLARLRAEAQRRKSHASEERAEQHRRAAVTAQTVWDRATPITDGQHPYLVRKQVPSHNLRITSNNELLIPIQRDGQLSTLQFITPDGHKRLLKNGRLLGAWCALPSPSGNLSDWSNGVVIAEGYATAATVARLSNLPTLAAFTATNLKSVALAVRQRYPHVPIVIAADDDRQKEVLGKPNTGKEKAYEAAQAANASVVLPHFPITAPRSATDWNDLEYWSGMEMAKAQFQLRLTLFLDQSREHGRCLSNALQAKAQRTSTRSI